MQRLKLKSWLKSTNGNMGTMFALSMVPLLMATGSAVDYSSLVNTRSDLQTLADGATLSAAASGEHDKESLDRLIRAFLSNTDYPDAVINHRIVNDTLTVTLSTTQDLLFMDVFGSDVANLNAEASAPILDIRHVNLSLVLDTTQSMSGSRLRTLRQAASELLDGLDQSPSEAIYASVIPFTDYVKIPVSYEDEFWIETMAPKSRTITYIDPNRSVNCRNVFVNEKRSRVCDETYYTTTTRTISWNGCMGSRREGYHTAPGYELKPVQGFVSPGYCEDNRNMMRPLTNNFAGLKNTVNSMVAFGETYMPAGIMWGWRTLRPDAPLTEAAQNPDARNIMILMTDGANTKSLHHTSAGFNGLWHTGENQAEADGITETLCADIKDDNIEIFTIAFDVDDEATKSLLEDCASSPAYYYDAGNNSGLTAAFESIGGKISNIRLTN